MGSNVYLVISPVRWSFDVWPDVPVALTFPIESINNNYPRSHVLAFPEDWRCDRPHELLVLLNVLPHFVVSQHAKDTSSPRDDTPDLERHHEFCSWDEKIEVGEVCDLKMTHRHHDRLRWSGINGPTKRSGVPLSNDGQIPLLRSTPLDDVQRHAGQKDGDNSNP